MTKDKALDLALEALEKSLPRLAPYGEQDWLDSRAAITAIKQARALDKKAENARELGLDYEPVATLFGSLPVYDITPQPAPVQPTAWPLATEEEKAGGWTLSYKFLESLSDRIDGRPAMETIESILMLTSSLTPPAQPAPASWTEMVTANLVREGIGKHKARELAEHFYGLAQPSPVQPVAWVDLLKQAEEVVRSKSLWKKYIDGTPLANDIAVWMASFAQEHTTPQAAQPAPAQEPFGYLFQHEETGLTTVVDVQQVDWGFEKNNPRHQKIGPLYTTPQQRPFVGLTDEEISDAMPGGIYDCLNDPWDCGVGDGNTLRSIKKDVVRIARAIEAKLRSKNENTD